MIDNKHQTKVANFKHPNCKVENLIIPSKP